MGGGGARRAVVSVCEDARPRAPCNLNETTSCFLPAPITHSLTDLDGCDPQPTVLQQHADAAGCHALAEPRHHSSRDQHILHDAGCCCCLWEVLEESVVAVAATALAAAAAPAAAGGRELGGFEDGRLLLQLLLTAACRGVAVQS